MPETIDLTDIAKALNKIANALERLAKVAEERERRESGGNIGSGF